MTSSSTHAHSHPRRRPASPTMTAASLLESFQGLSIRKGCTFHSPTLKKSELFNPFAHPSLPAAMPPRSATCPKELEDLLIGAGERRAADLLKRVDDAINKQSRLALCSILNEPEVLPVPSFMLDQTSLPERAVDDKQHVRQQIEQHEHASDSGLGSSLADSEEKTSTRIGSVNNKSKTRGSTRSGTTAVNRSAATIAPTTVKEECLSDFAVEQIHRFIIKPILREPTLADFHPLLRDVPRRIGERDIANLRDLEKTLIFLAPDFSRSPAAYLDFCERSIQCLHTTVDGVHESDQHLPSDRPYTNHYFLDLVEQIRRYASILAATREKQAKGEKLDEMDITPDEHLQLHGGMTQNGRPAELIRKKDDGKTISITTGHTIQTEDVAAASTKRPMSDEFVDEDGVHRSMARRKKNELPKTYTCKAPGCHKEFKRPCDLTKHVKTHDRPFKCPEENCKYYEYGWPTEKECDRHVNDKHSSAPTLYKCLFNGCPYTSKRESNCKQHMEKSHGWEYVRSKSNGKIKLPVTRLPRASVASTPGSGFATPPTPVAPSPSIHSLSSGDASRHGSMAPPSVQAGPSTLISPATPAFADFSPAPEFHEHFNFNFSFSNYGDGFLTNNGYPFTPSFSDGRRTSGATSHTDLSPSSLHQTSNAFEDAMPVQDFSYKATYGENLDTAMFGSIDLQQLTPASSTYENPNIMPNPLQVNNCMGSGANVAHDTFSPQFSPGAQGDLTLTSPDMYDNVQMDEGYEGNFVPSGDFALFGMDGAGCDEPLFTDQMGFNTVGSQFQTYLPAGNTNLEDLFPELKREH